MGNNCKTALKFKNCKNDELKKYVHLAIKEEEEMM